MAMPKVPAGAKTKFQTTSAALRDESLSLSTKTSFHDKKSLLEHAKVKKMKSDGFTKSKTTGRVLTSSESAFCETIAYDEHMDQGIPQTLLDGLGFHPEANGSNDEDDERISELSHDSAEDADEAMLVPSVASPTIPSILKKSRQRKRPKTSQASSAANTKVDQQARQSTSRLSPFDKEGYHSNLPIDLSKRPLQNPSPSSSIRPHTNLPPGNVQDEHHLQDYVVTRIARDEPKRNRRRSRAARISESAELSPKLPEIAEGCPFNEDNVEEVLTELMEHTDAMRRKMASMKDDMRRVCGTTASMRTKEQQNKGVEVSQRLQKAYLSYTMALENIERWDQRQNDEEQADNAS